MIDGTLDVAVANRPLSRREAAEPVQFRQFAPDAVVFAASLPNPVQGLSTAAVQGIYSGSITDWQQVGGRLAPILVLDRDEDESARKLVLPPMLGGRPVQARTIVLTTAWGMLEAVESAPNAVGYTSLGPLRAQLPRDVRVLALDGVVPRRETLADRSYPWHVTFGAVHRNDAPSAVRRFVDFMVGPRGRQVLQDFGYAVAEG